MVDTTSTFQNELLGRACHVEAREGDWLLVFGDRSIAVGCHWRIVSDEGIAVTDEDHGQLFGLHTPFDAEARANTLLSGAEVTSASIDGVTADVRLTFSNGHRLELINNSSGYEAWTSASIVALGGGGFSVF